MTEAPRDMVSETPGVDSLRHAPALVWQSDGGLTRAAFSDRWLAFTGRLLDAERGEGWLAGVHPDDIDALRAEVLAAERDARPYEHEYRLLRADGAYRWILEQAEPAVMEGETRFEGCCLDVTARHERDELRRLQEEALERIGPAVMATDAEGRIVRWNRRAEEMYGWKAEDVLGTNVERVNVPAMQASEARDVLAKVAAGEVWTGETAVRRADGTTFLARGAVAPILAEDGSIMGAVGASDDITDWHAERGPAARFGRLLDRSPNEIYIFDAETLNFTQVNRAALQNLGYSLEEMQELTPLDLKRTFSAQEFTDLVAPLRSAAAEQITFQTEHTRKDGTAYPVEVRLSLARGEVPPVFVAVIEDITEQRALEAELMELNRAKDQVLEDLAEGRKELDDLIQNIPGVVWEARGTLGSPDYQLTFVSNQVEEILGYLPGDIQGAKGNVIFSTIHPDDRDEAYAAAQRVYDDGRPNTVRFRWMTADGRPMWVQSYFCAIEDGDRVVGLRGVNIVVNEQQRSEELLDYVIEAGRILASSLDYEATLRNVAQLAVPTVADWCAVHVVDEQGNLQPVSVAHANPDYVAWVRDMQEQYRGRPRPARPTGPDLVVQTGESQLVPEVTQEMLNATVPDPGARRAVEQLGMRSYMCVPMELRGTIVGAISFVAAESGRRFDENDLRAAEHLARRAAAAVTTARLYTAAEQERARFRAIVSWLDHAVCQIDRQGRIEHVNPAAEALLGFPAGELQGRVFHDIVHPEAREEGTGASDDCPLVRVFTELEICRGSESFRRANGETVPVRVSCAPILLAGQLLGAIVNFEDISDDLEANVRKDNFLAFAAHELRNPLTPIIGLTRWLSRQVSQAPEGTFDEEFAEVAETLQSESERMGNIVEVFLDLSRIESNRLVLEPAPCDLRELASEAAHELQQRHPDAVVEVALPAESYHVISDRARLQQVLTNLLENAAKYGGDSPEVTVSLAEAGGRARIGVRDRGPGIPPEEQARIFERFYRSQSAGTKKGFGVGLFLAREIVSQLGGELSFVSTPGEGTEFVIEIPHRMPFEE